MSYNHPWSEAEENDAATLSEEEYRTKWDEAHRASGAEPRTRHALRVKKRDLAHGFTQAHPRPKAKPQAVAVEDSPTLSDAELYDAVIAYQQAIQRANQHTYEYRVTLDTDVPVAFCFPADIHLGSGYCDMVRARADFELIASHPRLYCALGGDMCDNFILPKMMEASRSMISTPDVQWRNYRYLISLVVDSLLWISSGNHDAWTTKVSGIDPILAALGSLPRIPTYTGEGGFIDVTVGSQTYTIWRKHKPRNNSNINRTYGGKQMLRMWSPREFDLGVNEHYHEPGYEVLEYRRRQRVIMNTGTYKREDPYAESGGYYTANYGVPTVIFWPDRHKMLPFSSIEDALEYFDGPSIAA